MDFNFEEVDSAVVLVKQGFVAVSKCWTNRAIIGARVSSFGGRLGSRVTETVRKDWQGYMAMQLHYRIALTTFTVNYLAAGAWDIFVGSAPLWVTVIPTFGFALAVSYLGYLGVKRTVRLASSPRG